MRRRPLVILTVLLASCGGGTSTDVEPGVEPAEVVEATEDVEESPAPVVEGVAEATAEEPDGVVVGHAPRPFTAEQIRDATPKGRFWSSRMELIGRGVVVTRTWVTASDANSVSLSTQQVNSQGELFGPVREQQATWEELRDHATFPADNTTITDADIQVGDAKLACRLYTVTMEQDGRVTTNRFYFANERPGAPVVFEMIIGDKLVRRMTTFEWGLEQDG